MFKKNLNKKQKRDLENLKKEYREFVEKDRKEREKYYTKSLA